MSYIHSILCLLLLLSFFIFKILLQSAMNTSGCVHYISVLLTLLLLLLLLLTTPVCQDETCDTNH